MFVPGMKGGSLVPLIFTSHKAVQFRLLYHLRELKPICKPIIESKLSIPSRPFLLPVPLKRFFPYLFSLPKRVIKNSEVTAFLLIFFFFP